MRKNSLKTKLVVSFALVALIAITIAGASILTSMRRTIEQEVQSKLLFLAESKEGQVFAYLDSLESRTVDFSSDGFIRDSLKEITNTGSVRAVNALNEYLVKNKKSLDPALVAINILDQGGIVVASTQPEEIGRNKQADNDFLEGKKGVNIIDAEKEEYPGLPSSILEATVLLTDKSTNEFLGVIVNIFNTEKLSDILSGKFQLEKGAISSNFGRTKTLAIYLVNKEKKVLAYGHEDIVDTIDTLPVQQCFSDKKEIVGTYINYFGEEVIGASMCFSRRGWVLLTEINTTEALASVGSTTYGLLIMLAFILVVVILDIYLIANNIIKPIKKLHEASDIIAKGNLDYRVDVKTKDEIEQLANAFNQMAVNLKISRTELEGYTKTLEEKAKERTFELQSKIKEVSESRFILQSLAEDIQKEKEGVEIKVEERTREIKEDQAQLAAAINSLSLGFILCDLNDKIILKNSAVSRILEIPESEITVDRIKNYFKGIADLEMYHSQCIKEKKTIEIKSIAAGEKFLHLLMIPVIMIRDSEEIIGHILLIEDITEAKVIERSREEFFAVASHELRTPLTAIRGNSSLIQEFYADKIKNKEVKAMISDIHEASVRLIKIVYDFLDVSALEQRKIEFKKEQFDIIALIQEVTRDLKGIANAKKLYLNLEKTDVALPMIMADRNRTKQVLFNLISNGINYTQKGGVSVKAEKQDKFLKVYVSDTGIGISPENQTLLFREFQQAGEKILTRDVTKGTGLGLYISKLLVEGMAGTIGLVKSEPGAGSVFGFTLPTAS